MNDEQRLLQLIRDAGLGDMSTYFTGSMDDIMSKLGFKGQAQKDQFQQFFQAFDPQKFLKAQSEASGRLGEQRSMLGTKLTENLKNLGTQFQTGARGIQEKGIQATRGIQQMMGKSGFGGFGAAGRERSRMRKQGEETFSDLLDKISFRKGAYQRQHSEGLLSAEKDYGSARGVIFAGLQDYINRLMGRAENIYGLDPGEEDPSFSGWNPPSNPGSGQTYTHGGQTYVWNDTLGEWMLQGGAGDTSNPGDGGYIPPGMSGTKG